VLRTRKAFSIVTLTIFLATLSIGYSGSTLPIIETSQAACAAVLSSIEVQPERVSVNQTIEIHGKDFGRVVECNDTGMGLGCQKQGVEMEVMQGVSIELIQGSQNWQLGTVEPNQNYAFDKELQLPDEVASGQATVIAEGNYEPVEVPISIVK
jgi:hypothetical protein